jgi:porphobilinogen synthase
MHVIQRPRRLRRTQVLRDSVAETHVPSSCLMMPYFVVPGKQLKVPVQSMPGIDRFSVDMLLRALEQDVALGLRQILLFGVPEQNHKDPEGRCASHEESVVCEAVRAIKKAFGNDLLVATDVCLCAYTTHGHCGVLHEGSVLNDATLPLLSSMALAHARAGADMVSPSDMMDGRIGHMRATLDAEGLCDTGIMSYAVKYASAYYGPFRDAAGSAPGKGDRKSYQMDIRNSREALREALLDVQEGADVLMVKPALAYLDIIAKVREHTLLPLACYNVSGEYAMLKHAAMAGLVDERAMVVENMVAMRRAGADLLITYHTCDMLRGKWI